MADTVDPDPPPPPATEESAETTPIMPAIPPEAPPPREGCMSKRSTLEKALIVIVVLILIILLALLIAFLIFYFFGNPPEGTCLTSNCTDSAARLKADMDLNADPCSDFYQYACGGWLSRNVLAHGQDKLDVLGQLDTQNRLDVNALLSAEKLADEPEFSKKAKTFFVSCMNMDRRSDREGRPFRQMLDSHLDIKFPVMDSTWNESSFVFEDTMVKLASLAVFPFISVGIRRDAKFTDEKRIFISDGSLGLETRAKYAGPTGRSDTAVKTYEKWLVEALVKLGADRPLAKADVKDVVDLEMEVARVMRKEEDKKERSNENNRVTVEQLKKDVPWFNWLDYLQGVAANDMFISADNEVINMERAYLEKLGMLLSNTSKRVQANYMLAQLLQMTSALSEEFVSIYDEYRMMALGRNPSPLWRLCTDQAIAMFPEAVSHMFVKEHFSEQERTEVETMVKDLRNTFKEALAENEWMDSETKEKAQAKLTVLVSKIGYFDDILDEKWVNDRYTGYKPQENRYLENLVAFHEFKTGSNFRHLKDIRNKDSWPVSPVSSTSYYSLVDNEIIFPAGFLQEPIYSPKYTKSMNYASLGSLIGREITKGFDRTGSKFNAKGQKETWWTKADQNAYDSRALCFVEQYGCYKWEGISMDGEQTLTENVADNGGVKLSMKAYNDRILEDNEGEKRLPGLSLNHHQIFFLAYAQTWCAKYRDEARRGIVENSPHTPSPYRVIGSLRNSEKFAEAFQCSMRSRMNPINKCLLW